MTPDDYGEQPVLRIAPTFERPSRPMLIRPAPRWAWSFAPATRLET